MKKKYHTFISGETIDLVIPNDYAIKFDNWWNWFNDEDTTKFLGSHGIFVNTVKKQKKILKEMIKKNESRTGLFLLIKPKKLNKVVGITSFSRLDLINKTAVLALVLNKNKTVDENFIYYGFEAKALMTMHGFEKFHLQKIEGGQALDLSEWQKFNILFGFRPNGLSESNFVKNFKKYSVIYSSCTLKNYIKMKNILGGNIWPGSKKFYKILKKFPKRNIYKHINNLIEKETNNYIETVINKIK